MQGNHGGVTRREILAAAVGSAAASWVAAPALGRLVSARGSAEPLSLEGLREAARKLPASIYRCKGVVHTVEEPGRRVILQVVGKRVDIAVGDEWSGREPMTRIVAIGAHDRLNGDLLREVFDRGRAAAYRPM